MEFMSSLSSAQDDLKPSLFELLSETHLHSLLPPTLQHLLGLAVHRHPRYLIRIFNRFDEFYALCMLVVEGYYLRKYAGGFTENFYGIKRERVVPGDIAGDGLKRVGPLGKFRRLTRKEILGSLLFGVGGEYVECKLESWYEALTVGEGILGRRRDDRPDAAAPTIEKLKYWLKFLFKTGYPPIKLLLSLQKLAFSLLYLFGNTAYPSLSFYLLGLRPRRVTSLDMPPPKIAAGSGPTARQLLTHPLLLLRTAGPLALSSLKIILPTGIFFLKFLEWWYASDFARQLSSASQKAIELPPPARLPSTDHEIQLREKNEEKGVGPGSCPVCTEDLNNPTICQTGAVCCYKCAFAAAEEGRCAVTGREVLGGTSGLRRLIV